jgi:hypothetical protein
MRKSLVGLLPCILLSLNMCSLSFAGNQAPYCKVSIRSVTAHSAWCHLGEKKFEIQNNTDESYMTEFLSSQPSGINLYIVDTKGNLDDEVLIYAVKFCDLTKSTISYNSSIICSKL